MDYGERLVHLVDATYANQNEEDGLREHLGASVIGEKCQRRLWLGFRWASAEEFEGRMLRLFQRGHESEASFANLLRALGASLWTVDANGKQFRFSDLGGHYGGALDGVATNLPELTMPVLLEMKTHKGKLFEKLKKDGLEVAFPKHYKQAQVYMDAFGLSKCLYCATNKDTDEVWFYLFDFQPAIAAAMRNRAESIIFGEGLPPRISETPTWWECQFCPMRRVCFKWEEPKRNCRTCLFSKPNREGGWECTGRQPEITTQPKQGCNYYQVSPLFSL